MKKIILAFFILGLAVVNQKSFGQTTIQFLHNSADTSLSSVDVYLDSVKTSRKIVSNLAFGKVNAPVTVSLGAHTFLLTRSGDTVNVIYPLSDSVPSGTNQMNIIYGVKNPAKYASNPDGVNTALSIATVNNFSTPIMSSASVLFFNGSTDAPTYDVNKINSTQQKIANDFKYADLNTGAFIALSGKNLITITSKDSTVFYYTYYLDLTSSAGKAAILFTSGVNIANTSNPVGAASFSLNIAFSNGTVKQLNPVWGKFQVIHNSADSAYDSLDVYYNNTLYTLGFRTATALVKIPAYTPLKLSIALKHSSSNASAFYTSNFVLDSSTGYTNLIIGQGPDQTPAHITNPEGVSTSFTVKTYKGLKDTAMYYANVDLLYFHGATDLMKTNMLGYNGTMFISKGDIYSTFHNQISYNPAINNLEFDLNDGYMDTTLIKKIVGNIGSRTKQVGVIFPSGYYSHLMTFLKYSVNDSTLNANMTQVQQTRILGLYIAWADGSIDTIQTAKINDGVKESFLDKTGISFYPNPVSDQLNISIDLKAPATIKTEFTDITGKVIRSSENNCTTGHQLVIIETKDLKEGFYFCSVSINGQKLVKKICVIN
ncbi:MAG: T9SS type A sorting domain-containing protein [Bacteroidia bacterium]